MKYPLGKHPNNLMPYKVIPRYGLGAGTGSEPIPGELFLMGFFRNVLGNDGKFGQARPMKHEFCRDKRRLLAVAAAMIAPPAEA